MSITFKEIIQKYHSDGVVFSSPKRGSHAYYCIGEVDDTGFSVVRLTANEPERCSYSVLERKLELVREAGGHIKFAEISNTTAIHLAYLQAANFGVSIDRKEILDLTDDSEAFKHFQELIKGLNIDLSGKQPKLYKPVILWCVFDAIRNGELNENRIEFDWLVPRFLKKFEGLGIEARENNAAEAYCNLTRDLFWLLAYEDPQHFISETQSTKQLREHVNYALIKDTYWRLLSNPQYVETLIALIETYWFSKATGPTNFWWVNQGKTYQVEKDGQFVWAPQKSKSGSTFFHWENVSKIAAGDIIFNYANGAIVAVSLARSSGYERTRPENLQGGEWKKPGWSADCEYYELSEPIELEQVAQPILELKLTRGPINSSARVNQSYLFELTKKAAKVIADVLDLSDFPEPLRTHLAALIEAPQETIHDSSQMSTAMKHELNTILYGPPGTGKTYETIQLAVEICDGFSNFEDRAQVVDRFKELREKNQIEFVTFHQSYGYENFIEGIRPVLSNDSSDTESETQQIRYECQDGVFKKLCKLATPPKGQMRSLGDLDPEQSTFWKMSLGGSTATNSVNEIYDECIENNCLLMGYGSKYDLAGYDNLESIQELMKDESEHAAKQAHLFKNELKVGDVIIASDGQTKFRGIARVTGEYKYLNRTWFGGMRPVEWLVEFEESQPLERISKIKFARSTLYQLKKSALDLEEIQSLLSDSDAYSPQNRVMIIDEINRGNISKIFGELITLLEHDKRIGGDNELQVRLPSSGDIFGIPENVYVIGTMNTADRSIAFLDVALRRRFKFIEKMPNSDVIRQHLPDEGVIENIDVAGILDTINDRIELLYDRDHQIGHSYFLKITTLHDLRNVICDKIIPLLQEYFYGDWMKISVVLGCPIDEEKGKPLRSGFPSIIEGKLLTVDSPSVAESDFIENKVRCQISEEFLTTDASDRLAEYFAAISSSE